MIKLEHAEKHYEHFDLNVSLKVLPGRVTGLVGKNGAGKSTTFKLILGLIAPDAGSVEVLGKDPLQFTMEEKQAFGAALSDSGFSSYLSIKDIIPILKSLYKNFDEAFFREKCREFQLPADQRIQQYSTGMKAKLKMLAAISHKAKLLVLDEPTAGLDVAARNEILDILRGYMEIDEENAILISSHITSDLENLCDDIYLIDQGEIMLHEETDVIMDRYGIVKADEVQFEKMDKNYIVRYKRESYGYECLVSQKDYYLENYPGMVVEKGSIDEVMLLMIGGESVGTAESRK